MPFTVGNLLKTAGTVRGSINAARAHAVECSCPACTGLQCLERPRFFAGQLLSEAELNSGMDYILAKQRLHNRYLHGVGTVCGLEVVCSSCDGQVIIKPGYAIDPCGNDVIVCEEQPFDVMKAIKSCCDDVRKQRKTGCNPYIPSNEGCTGLEQHWCITIAYQEIPKQPVTPLRGAQKTCSCAGSSSSVGGCGCSNGNGSSTKSSNGCSSSSTGASATPITCEPTRILESYQLGVMPDPKNCATKKTLLQDTLLFKLFGCLSTLTDLQSNFTSTTWKIIELATTQKLADSEIAPADAFLACCQYRQYVVDLFANGEFATKCGALNKFDALPCPQPPGWSNIGRHSKQVSGEKEVLQQVSVKKVNLSDVTMDEGGMTLLPEDKKYLQQVQESITVVSRMLAEYIRECICHTLLPACPTDPGDDRLVLACLTIKDGKIIDICNFGCRQFAGGFPSFFHWLSIIPIGPLCELLIDQFCCQSASKNATVPPLDQKKIDPAGLLQKAVVEGNSALPKMLMERIGDIAQKFSLQGLIGSIPANGFNLATVRGMSLQNAQEALKSFGVSVEHRQVNSRAEIPLLPQTPTALSDMLMPFARPGDHVVLFETAGAVVEVQRVASAQSKPTDVADLRQQVELLKADIAKLKSNAAQARKK